MERFRAKLERGEPVEIVVVGDSIARGDEATIPSAGFVSLWADGLHKRYGCRVQVTNHSYGGYTIRDAHAALRRIRSLSDHDLVVLAVGVNDATCGVPLRVFRRTLARVARHAEKHGLDLMVVTPLAPANADVAPYAVAIRESGCAVADVNAVWGATTLVNGVNHPGDEGHRLYARVLAGATAHQSAPASVGNVLAAP